MPRVWAAHGGIAFLATSVVGCGNVLGADFDPSDPAPSVRLSLTLPEHPHETPHPGLPLPPVPLTGNGRVTSDDGAVDCTSSCEVVLAPRTILLTALPDQGSMFGGWHTDPPTPCDGTRTPTCSVDLGLVVAVEAYFVQNGANVWANFAGAAADDVVHMNGLASDATRAFVVGETNAALANLSLPASGNSVGFLSGFDGDGNWKSANVISAGEDTLALGVDLAPFGPVVAGYANGLTPSVVELEPFGTQMESNGAFVVAYDDATGKPEPRWAYVLGGANTTMIQDVAVAGDTTLAFGMFDFSLVTPKTTLESSSAGTTFLAAIDRDGTEKWVRVLGGGAGAYSGAHVVAQSDDTFVVVDTSSGEVGLDAFGGNCGDPPSGRAFIARFDLASKCLGVLTLPATVTSVEDLVIDDDQRIVVAGRFQEEVDFGGVSVSTLENEAFFIVRLMPDLSWKEGSSWLSLIEGADKFGSLGISSDSVAFSVGGQGPLLVAEAPFDATATRSLLLGKLDANGTLEWLRSFGDSAGARALDIRWDGEGWLVAGTVDADPFRPFDFENVTQPPVFLGAMSDMYVARFAD